MTNNSMEGRSPAVIRVVGVGGGGGNAVTRMKQDEIGGIEYISVNTDVQALSKTLADKKIQIGEKKTRGLGAGGHPEVGTEAANESADALFKALEGSDMVFITTGMGGGTGTGAAPVIAQLAREAKALTVAVVTKPFDFEGKVRMQNAEMGIAALKDKVDTLIVLPNQRLLEVVDKTTPISQAFKLVDEVLRQGIQGIAEVITTEGYVNRDFEDVRTIMSESGSALMAIGRAKGDGRAVAAAQAAISNPLQEDSINGAKGMLIVFTVGSDFTLFEMDEAARIITEVADPNANIITGIVNDESLDGEIKITLVATGFENRTGAAGKDSSARSSAFSKPTLRDHPPIAPHGPTGNSLPSAKSTAPADGNNHFQRASEPSREIEPSPVDNVPEFLRNREKLIRRQIGRVDPRADGKGEK